MGVVYKITIPQTGKSYIGKTIQSFKIRWAAHVGESDGSYNTKDRSYFHSSLRKYGFDDVVKEILFESDIDEELYEKEIEYIKLHNTLVPNGYNISEGGKGSRVFNRINVKDKDGNIITVSVNDERYVSGELILYIKE